MERQPEVISAGWTLTALHAGVAHTSLYSPVVSEIQLSCETGKTCQANVSCILQTLLLSGSLKAADKRKMLQEE